MADEKYVKETFKPDKLWACKSVTESAFPGITPPADSGGGGMYQIGEDLNFTLGSYYDYEIPEGTVNGDALYNAEYKAGAYVVNKGYIYNYIGDSGYYHVFVNVRNDNPLGNYGTVTYGAVDIRCEILAFMRGNASTPEGGAFCAYTCMPRGTDVDDDTAVASHQNIKVNGTEFYSGKYIDEKIKTLYKHNITLTPEVIEPEYAIICTVINTFSEPYQNELYSDSLLSSIELGYLYAIQGYTTIGLVDLNKTLVNEGGAIRFRSDAIIFAASGYDVPKWNSSIPFTVTDTVTQI